MKIAIQVKHSDGRIGHLFYVTEIEPNKEYRFRYQKSKGHGYVAETIKGNSLTKKGKEYLWHCFDKNVL